MINETSIGATNQENNANRFTLISNNNPRIEKTRHDKITEQSKQAEERTYGNGELSDLLTAAPERKWIWIGGLKESITLDNVKEYVKQKFANKEVYCYDLKSKYRKKCYKIGSSEVSYEDLIDPDNWPKSIIIRPFQYRPSVKQQRTNIDPSEQN